MWRALSRARAQPRLDRAQSIIRCTAAAVAPSTNQEREFSSGHGLLASNQAVSHEPVPSCRAQHAHAHPQSTLTHPHTHACAHARAHPPLRALHSTPASAFRTRSDHHHRNGSLSPSSGEPSLGSSPLNSMLRQDAHARCPNVVGRRWRRTKARDAAEDPVNFDEIRTAEDMQHAVDVLVCVIACVRPPPHTHTPTPPAHPPIRPPYTSFILARFSPAFKITPLH